MQQESQDRCESPEACVAPNCSCGVDPGIEMGLTRALDPNVGHELKIVVFEDKDEDADSGVPAVVVYLDNEMLNFSYRSLGDGDYDSEEYADGFADAMSMAGLSCTVDRYHYDYWLDEGEQPEKFFDQLDTRYLSVVEQESDEDDDDWEGPDDTEVYDGDDQE